MADHRYLSTACAHAVEDHRPDLHVYCQTETTRADGTVKIPGQCKWCSAKCVCECHREGK